MNIGEKEKASIVNEWVGSEVNSGSTIAQIGLITERIKNIAKHLATGHKDYSSRRGLVTLVSKRRKLIKYLKKTDEKQAEEILAKIKLVAKEK